MGAALNRVRDILTLNISPHFPGNRDVEAAIQAVNHLINTHSSSDLRRYLTPTLRPHPSIRADKSDKVIRLFNIFNPLEESDLAFVRRNLGVILQTAVWGVSRVIRYFQNTAVWIPRTMLTQEIVYLKDCGELH
jgi:hypothetical protein